MSRSDRSGFDAEIYRKHNLDLRHLTDEQLADHFLAYQSDARTFGPTETTAEFLSMRWLRGTGLEVGAGGHPTKTFSATHILQADVDTELLYGGKTPDVHVSVDDPKFPATFDRQFDFAVASHVLEHCDSFIRAIKNLINIVRMDGIVYLVLPDIQYLHDANWISYFDFAHHVDEFDDPLTYSDPHDREYIAGVGEGINDPNHHADLSQEYRDAVKAGRIPQEYRYLQHKHNYKFGGWTEMVEDTRKFLGKPFELLESCYGRERFDCHFLLRRVR